MVRPTPTRGAIWLADGKDGVAFNRYRNALPGKLHVLWDKPDVWHLAEQRQQLTLTISLATVARLSLTTQRR